jgi:hypothetical protein
MHGRAAAGVNLTAWTTQLQRSVSGRRLRHDAGWNGCGGRSQPEGWAGQQRSELQALLGYLLAVLANTRWNWRVLAIQSDCRKHSTSEDRGRRGGLYIFSHFIKADIQTCL